MPSRKDIEPTEIPDLLANVVLVDVTQDPLDFRYRLIGTAIVERIAFDYTGKHFTELAHQQPGSQVWETAPASAGSARPSSATSPMSARTNGCGAIATSICRCPTMGNRST